MKSYASLRKQNKSGTMAAIVVLLLCVLTSAAMLCSRLMVYSPENKCQNIPLTQSNGLTHVTKLNGGELPYTGSPVLAPLKPVFLTAAPGFEAHDKNTVWAGETNVEIFSLQYDNESGETTVRSQDGTKIFAPGTGSTYEFALENTGNVSLDYTLEMEAWFSDAEYPIPIFASVTGHEGNYLLGGEGEMVDVLRLSEVQESGSVAAGNILPYSLNWEWPFELDDEYDTMLGNMAVDEDISLTIVIRTTASYSPDPDQPGGVPPQTGDTSAIMLCAILMVASLAGILFILLLRDKEEENEVP